MLLISVQSAQTKVVQVSEPAAAPVSTICWTQTSKSKSTRTWVRRRIRIARWASAAVSSKYRPLRSIINHFTIRASRRQSAVPRIKLRLRAAMELLIAVRAWNCQIRAAVIWKTPRRRVGIISQKQFTRCLASIPFTAPIWKKARSWNKRLTNRFRRVR